MTHFKAFWFGYLVIAGSIGTCFYMYEQLTDTTEINLQYIDTIEGLELNIVAKERHKIELDKLIEELELINEEHKGQIDTLEKHMRLQKFRFDSLYFVFERLELELSQRSEENRDLRILVGAQNGASSGFIEEKAFWRDSLNVLLREADSVQQDLRSKIFVMENRTISEQKEIKNMTETLLRVYRISKIFQQEVDEMDFLVEQSTGDIKFRELINLTYEQAFENHLFLKNELREAKEYISSNIMYWDHSSDMGTSLKSHLAFLGEMQTEFEDGQKTLYKAEELRNTCYYFVGNKGELIEKKLLSKKKAISRRGIAKYQFDPHEDFLDYCHKRHIRDTVLIINERIKAIHSIHPSSSFKISTSRKRSGNTTIEILDAESFWRFSNVLVLEDDTRG